MSLLRRRPLSRRTALGYAAAIAAAIGLASVLVINTTSSVTPGLYMRAPFGPEPARGDFVVACMPPGPGAALALERGYVPPARWGCASGAVPLLKRVRAVAGDTVWARPTGPVSGGRAVGLPPPRADTEGRPLEPVAGRFVLGPGEVWLGSDTSNGYDSRYLGPVGPPHVLGPARLLVRF